MDETNPKRRLPIVSDATPDAKQMLNEVLPAPTREAAPTPARQRTLERMAKLLAIAAASTAIQAKCGDQAGIPPPHDASADTSPGYMVVDPVPEPAPDVVVPTPPQQYMVVDPVPPPARRDPHGTRRRRGPR